MQFVQYLCTLPSNDTYGYIQALPLAKVYVYEANDDGSSGPLVNPLYAADGITTISNPLDADINGFAGFGAPDGLYNIQVTDATGDRSAPLAVKVQLFDQTTFSEVAGVVAQAVIGPVSNVDSNIPQFDGTTGNKIKDGGLALDTDGTLGANSDSRIPSQKAVKTYVAAAFGANDAMIFKGVIDCSANPNYPAADRGATYRVSVAGKIGGASGVNVEASDLLICLTDSTAFGNQATVGSAWTIAQANIDGAVVGPASATDGNLAMFNGATGKIIKDGSNTLANPLIFPNGSASAPSAVWNTNYGMFWDAANSGLGVAVAGVEVARYSSGGVTFVTDGGSIAVALQAYATTNNPIFSMNRARGSLATPAVPQTGDLLGSVRYRGWTTGTTFGVGAHIDAVVEETTWSATALGTYLQFSVCADGSASLTEIARLNVANGLQMFGTNVVIDQNRAHRLRSTTIAGQVAPSVAGNLFYHSDAQGGTGEIAVDTGSAYRYPGQAAIKHLTGADSTYTPRADGRIVRDNVALAADHGLTLLTTNVTDGHKMELHRRGSSGGFNRKVYQADGTTLIASVADNGNATFVYDATATLWYQV